MNTNNGAMLTFGAVGMLAVLGLVPKLTGSAARLTPHTETHPSKGRVVTATWYRDADSGSPVAWIRSAPHRRGSDPAGPFMIAAPGAGSPKKASSYGKALEILHDELDRHYGPHGWNIHWRKQ